MPKFSVEEKNLILIQSLVFFATSLAGIFVNVFFFSHTDLKTTVLYNFIVMSSLLFFFVLSGWSLRKVSSGTLVKIGLGSMAFFYLLLFLLKDRAIDYLMPLGLLSGFAGGNYWSGFNLNQYVFTNRLNRVKYFGLTSSVISILQATAPAIGGVTISLVGKYTFSGLDGGYGVLFFVVFLILAVTTIVVGKLPSHVGPEFSYIHILEHSWSPEWKRILGQQALLGLYDVSLGVVTGILIYLIVREEIILGSVQTVAFLLGAMGSFISIRLLRKDPKFYWIGAVGLAVGIGVFALSQSVFGVLSFILITGFTSPFLGNWSSIVFFHTLDDVKTSWKQKYHLLLERDIALGIPRILSFLILYIFLQFGDQVKLAKAWLFVLPIIPLLVGFLLKKQRSK